MKTRAILAATAIAFSSFVPVLNAPAMAGQPTYDITGLTPDQICEDQLKPADPAEFDSYLVQITDPGIWTDVGEPYADETSPAGEPEGYGTPTYSNIFLTTGFFRNGGSPNVWGGATATATYPQTRQLFDFKQDQTRTVTFDCVVAKVTPAGTHFPPGLQSIGNTTVEEQTIDVGEDYLITDEPFVEEGETVYALICISPNNVTKGKPGTWTGKHGFNAANCPAASAAAGGTIPSGNAPVL
jgi:hypothetical protein